MNETYRQCVCDHVMNEHEMIHGNMTCKVILEPADLEEEPVYCMCGEFSPKK